VETAKLQNNKFRAILVDFDGVLRQWPTSDILIEKKYGLPQNSIRLTAFDTELLDQAIRGKIKDEEWRLKIAENLQVSQPDSDAQSAINEWSSYSGEVNAELLGVLASLRSKIKILLVTNATSRLSEDLAILGLDNWFTEVINSSDVGSIKPEQEIYRIAIQACDCSTAEILYIDDSSTNISVARKIGILSHRYTDLEDCKRFLSEIGLSSDAYNVT